MLKLGDPMPAFALPDETGEIVRSVDLAGKRVVIFVYPWASTPG
jgi:thioredoxin-dependent peroxiredoxin